MGLLCTSGHIFCCCSKSVCSNEVVVFIGWNFNSVDGNNQNIPTDKGVVMSWVLVISRLLSITEHWWALKECSLLPRFQFFSIVAHRFCRFQLLSIRAVQIPLDYSALQRKCSALHFKESWPAARTEEFFSLVFHSN